MLTDKAKIGFYITIISVLSVILYYDYTYKIPYNYDFYDIFFEFPPKESPHTWTWLFLLLTSTILVLPLIFKQKIGILGLLFLVTVISKSFVIEKVPTQTALEFVNENKKELVKVIKQKQNKRIFRSSSIEIKKIGFKRYLKIKSTNFFIIDFHEYHFYGICFKEENKENLATKIGQKIITYEKICPNWYTFKTFTNSL
jgi:hypothetical protein